MVRYAIVAALLLIGSAGGDAQLPDEDDLLRQQQAEIEAALAEINREMTAIYVNAEAMNCSPRLRAEEARSLAARFPGIVVDERFSPAQFRDALRAEDQRRRERLLEVMIRLRTIYRAQACTALGDMRQSIDDLRADPGYPRLPLDARMALERLIELGEQDNPCTPLVEPPPDPNDPMNQPMVGMVDSLATLPQCGDRRGERP